MPQKIICGGCGEIFYNGKDLKPPEEVIQQLNGICPKCKKQLSFKTEHVEIKAVQEL